MNRDYANVRGSTHSTPPCPKPLVPPSLPVQQQVLLELRQGLLAAHLQQERVELRAERLRVCIKECVGGTVDNSGSVSWVYPSYGDFVLNVW